MPRPAWIRAITSFFLLAGIAPAAFCGFVENAGQHHRDVRFRADHGQVAIFVTECGLVLDRPLGVPGSSRRVAITLRPGGGDPRWTVSGRGLAESRRHYLLGSDPTRWRSDVREYDELVCRRAADGLALVIALGPGGIRYRTERDGGAVAEPVRWTVDGVAGGRTLVADDRSLETEAGPLRHRRSPGGTGGVLHWGATLRARATRDTAGLAWSTFLGGSGAEKGLAVRSTPAGDLVLTGRTSSPAFPTTPGSYDQEHAGENDVFVAKVTADGDSLLWSTFIGGAEYEVGQGIQVAPDGDVVVVGNTSSVDFPTTPGAYAPAAVGQRDGWALRLSADGSALVWSTYLGGTGIDDAGCVGLDAAGRVVVAGNTMSVDFPTSANAFDRVYHGDWDVFLLRLSSDGTALDWSTLAGGGGLDTVYGLVLSDDGECVLAGTTSSTLFPVTAGAFDAVHGGGFDAFALAMSSDGSALSWSTFLGGDGNDSARGIALDAAGRPLVCGATNSPAFPTTPGSYATELAGVDDGFVACLASRGTQLRWSTLLGGSEPDGVHAVASGPGGMVLVTGTTRSADFPITETAFDDTWDGGLDVFVSSLTGSGSVLDRSTYLGGDMRDDVYDIIAVDGERAVIVGHSDSPTFPTTAGAYDEEHGGESDVVLCALPTAPIIVTDAPPSAAGALTLRNHPNPFNPTTVFSWANPRPASVSLTIHDVAGRRVRSLVAGERVAAGRHDIRWDGRDADGREVPAGTYLARLTVAGRVACTSVALVR